MRAHGKAQEWREITAQNQSDPSHCIDLVSNERTNESFVWKRAAGARRARRDGEEAAEQGGPTQASQPREGRAIPSVTTEPRDLIVPVRIGTNSNHLFQIY